VSNHVFVDENWNVLATVMDRNGQADEVREDHRAARPGLYGPTVIGRSSLFHLFQQVMIHEGTFLK
jgi:hypothetical protein